MSLVTVGEVIQESKSASVLGISDRAKIVNYIKRALDLGTNKSNYNSWIGKLDTCSDACGYVTLPSFIETVLAVNVGGQPSLFRDKWFEFHINGPGSTSWGTIPSTGGAYGYGLGMTTFGMGGIGVGNTWDDRMTSPTFQDITEPSVLACICENEQDGAAGLQLSVQGIVTSPQGYQEQALTTDAADANSPYDAIFVPLKWSANGIATSDPKSTLLTRVTQVVKPVTKGYVRLYAISPQQGHKATLIGVYGPGETKPQYKRIRVSSGCNWVRLMFRIKTPDLLYDHDIVPIPSLDVMLGLIKAVRWFETNNYTQGKEALAIAIQELNDIQSMADGPAYVSIQVDPSWGGVQMDLR